MSDDGEDESTHVFADHHVGIVDLRATTASGNANQRPVVDEARLVSLQDTPDRPLVGPGQWNRRVDGDSSGCLGFEDDVGLGAVQPDADLFQFVLELLSLFVAPEKRRVISLVPAADLARARDTP